MALPNAAPSNMGPRTGYKFTMSVLSGPDAGISFQLLPPKVTIGRGADNHIVLNDPRVSRAAAAIEFSMEVIAVRDLSGRNSLLVNGQPVGEASLRDGDQIGIGESVLSFHVEALALAPPRAPGLPSMPLPPPPSGGSSDFARMEPGVGVSGDSSGKVRFYIILAVVLGGLFWLLNEEQKTKKPDVSLRTVEEYEKDMKESEKRREELAKKTNFANPEEKQRYESAQRFFLEGFRDYQKGQWTRAMQAFETARVIYPQHQLAIRYYKLAEKGRDEMIALLTLEGRRYREKNMYARCSAQFEKVLDLIPNKEDVKHKTAKALKEECDDHLDQRF